MKVIDVTLRESVYYESGMNYGDRLQYLKSMCECVSNEFVQYIEISFIDNDVENDMNYNEAYIQDAYEICRGKFKLVAMIHPGKADWTKWNPDVIRMLDMVRIMVPVGQMETTPMYVNYFHNLGVKVACNVLYTCSAPLSEIIKMEREAVKMNFDYFYCADSSGSFTPWYTRELSTLLVENRGQLELGLHLHDHMRMALANALIARECGIEMADVSITGAGKGGGNMKMEESLLLLYGTDKIDFDLLHGMFTMFSEFNKMVSRSNGDTEDAFLNFLTGIFKLNLKDIERLEKLAGGNMDVYFKYLLGDNCE